MNFELRFKSIAIRWFANVFLIIAIAVTFAAIAFSVLCSSIYIDRVDTLADDYASYFSALSSATKETFEDAAIQTASSFEHKTLIEVQVLNSEGKVIVSTTGFQPTQSKMDDYERALTSADGTASFKGKSDSGERILARTNIIYDKDGERIGAYRWITSLRGVNRRIFGVICIISVICIAVFGFCAVSGLYFIKSIVRPIRDVSNMARKIAMGDFETRIEIKKYDEIGELCDTINYMASELSHAETMKNDFISSVSHELRTPLTAIRGWGETAKMSIGYDEELVTRGLDVVLSEADRLSSLVEELLDFSRMQNGRLALNVRPDDVSVLLSSAVDMYTELARQQGVEISYNAPMTPSVVMGDRDRLKQVFINIIDNAVKYTEKGGLVLITQTREEGCVRIMVKDTGVGIPASDIDHVKEKFFKSNKTVRGSGIGLAVADEIIKQHDGLLFLESTEGVGTTVTIVLPLCEEPEPTPNEDIIPPTLPEQQALPEVLDEQTEETAEIPVEETQGEESVETIEGEENV